MSDLERKKDNSVATCPKCGKQHRPESICVAMSSHKDPLLNTVFADRYEIVSLLGAGGMSAVYKARHALMDRMVAIKILVASDVPSLKRFQLEAKLVSNLKHHNIVTVFDFGISPDGQPFLVMDYLEGHSLEVEIRKVKHLEVHRAVQIFCQACDALYYAHKRDLIHRDLKPSNFMIVTEEGEDVLKLVDFGIAKSVGSAGEGHKLTKPGMVMGSPVYMSPEQCLGRKLDNRSDIYSLGCVMYECLTGKAPLVGETVVETLHKHVHESPRSFASVSPEFISIPEQLENIVFKCLEREPEKRYPTMLELWTDLELFQNSIRPAQTRITQTDLEAMKTPVTLTSNPIEYVKENNTGLILIVVSIVLLGCVFTYSQLRPKQPEISEPEVAYAGATEKAKKEMAANQFDQAVKDYKEATRAAEKFDAKDPRLAEALTALGRIYFREDFYPEAERAFKRALALRTDIFGKTSLPAAESMSDLGLVYCAEGYSTEAEEPLEQALKIRKQNAGDDSVDYANSLKDIAVLYSRTGKDAEALQSLQKAMTIRTKTLGSIDPSNIETQIGLAMAYIKKGDLAKGADLCNVAHRTALRSYDLGDPIVADALVGLAAVQSAEKKYDDAQKSYLEALEIRDKWFGKKSIKAAQVMLGMAANLEAQDKADEAAVLYKEALQIEETTLGPGDPESKETARRYAENLRSLDKEKDAEDLETRFGLTSAKTNPAADK